MKRVNVSIIILLLALASASNAIAGSGYAIVIDVVPTMTKISKQEQIQKGTSGVGATGGGLAGTWVGFKWGGVPGAILGAGVGALSGNALENGIRDKKTVTNTQESTIQGFYVKLSNGKSFYTTTKYQKGQRISLKNIESQ